MPEKKLTISHAAGLHARPASLFVRTAARFQATLRVRNLSRDPEREANPKSILSLMTLGIEHGHEILIQAEGPDADEALTQLEELVQSNFGEG